jgi:hypothetical protein
MADDGLWSKLEQTWPARAAQGLWDGLMLPGDVAQGNVSMWGDDGHTSPQVINRSADLAGTMMMGATAAPRGALGSGFVRPLPRDNYAGPINRYAPEIYRETAPDRALEMMPGSSAMESGSPFGANRQFYADHRDLATGQNDNSGVLMKFDAAPFEGIINTKKPAWDLAWQQGMGEYLAAPMKGESLKQALLSADIDKSMLKGSGRVTSSIMNRTLQNLADKGWKIDDSGKLIAVTRPSVSQ